MSIIDSLSNLIGQGDPENENTGSRNPMHGMSPTANSLCVACDNNPYCVWEDNNKIFCEHYE